MNVLRSLVLLSLSAGAALAQESAAIQHFESKVRPLLADQCFKCHGPDKQRGGLRVDGRAHLLQGGDLGPAIVPGEPVKSLLVKAIRHTDPGLKMPPKMKLSKSQADDVALWIKAGAPWPGDAAAVVRKGEKEITAKDREHWAFKPVVKPVVPKGVHPIDALVAKQLAAKGLKPNPPASKQELIRRATYNLTGLPPTSKEVDDFVRDASPQAYVKLIDRLLESPRYGEKWARHWLDLVRYAETNSYERDSPKPNAWRYRDYVIKSFNADTPYDRFVREQLAGDEIPNPGPDQITATGYYRLGIWDDEPSDRLLARYDGLDDLVMTTSQVFLGITLDCARCHDHKIDPFQQKDYYRFLAFFHNVNHYRNGGATDEAPLFANSAEKNSYDLRLKKMAERRDQVQQQITALESEVKTAEKTVRPDMDDLKFRFYRSAWTKLPDFDALKAETVGELPGGYFDLAPRTRLDTHGFVFEGTLIVPKTGTYTFYLDSDDGSRLTIAGQKLIEYDGIHGVGNEKSRTINLKAGRVPIRLDYFQNVGGYGLYVAWSGPEMPRRLLSTPPSEKNASADFFKGFRDQTPRGVPKDKLKEYAALKKELESLKDPVKVVGVEKALCVTEAGPRPAETFVFFRGNPALPRDRVEPGFPLVLGFADPAVKPLAKTTGRRTALADWIASRDNPLSSRVIVNRLWQFHFGRGLVRSASNFGVQGDRPTHPELLDWLAATFVEKGWSMKEFHRLVMTSNLYQASTRGQPEALAVDPANDLLWRFDMRRLSAEEIRDSVLAVSGNLNLQMFGPGIYPEIPKEVLAGQSIPGKGWGKSTPEEQARRSVYVHIKRSLLLPILEAFDAAETDRSAPVRFSSTVPTQALMMINSAFLNKQAEIFAERLRRESGTLAKDQVRSGLSLATSRPPTEAEIERGLRLISGLREGGASPELALKYFCLMALNLNEFVYLD